MMLRSLAALLIAIVAGSAEAAVDKPAVEAAFRTWLDTVVRPQARAAGIDSLAFDRATAGLAPDWSLPDLEPPGAPPVSSGDAFQAEFRSPASYLAEKRLAGLARDGRAKLAARRALFAEAERRYGVPAAIVAAVWGRESDFGRAKIPHDALRALATQAFMGSRRGMFLPEFVAMLKIAAEGGLPRSILKSSWAGALGQPQFLPTKMLSHAVDMDGDGRRDIWTSEADIIGSIAHYLADFGWRRGVEVALEVEVPSAVSCTLEGPDKGRPLAWWAERGVTATGGRPLARQGLGSGDPDAHLLMPAGRRGPAFLVSANFYVLKAYNESDLYALFIGHLADRIETPEARIAGRWQEVKGLRRADVRDLQIRLNAAGYDTGGADGLAGWRTRTAIGQAEEAAGKAAICFP